MIVSKTRSWLVRARDQIDIFRIKISHRSRNVPDYYSIICRPARTTKSAASSFSPFIDALWRAWLSVSRYLNLSPPATDLGNKARQNVASKQARKYHWLTPLHHGVSEKCEFIWYNWRISDACQSQTAIIGSSNIVLLVLSVPDCNNWKLKHSPLTLVRYWGISTERNSKEVAQVSADEQSPTKFNLRWDRKSSDYDQEGSWFKVSCALEMHPGKVPQDI